MKTFLQCNASVRGDKLDDTTANLGGGGGGKNNLQKNANKSYHVYKVIVELHIYNKILGIR